MWDISVNPWTLSAADYRHASSPQLKVQEGDSAQKGKGYRILRIKS